MTRPRRTFTPEYKAEVVALVQEGGKSPHRVAKDLGLTSSAVAGWAQQARIDAGAGGSADLTTEARHELWRKTTDSNHAAPVAPNYLDRQFAPSTPNTVWAGDITCLKVTAKGFNRL